jgi:hypothetical protein
MPLLTHRQARRVGRTVALARALLGLGAITLPSLPGRPWVGRLASEPGGKVLARALGGRDLALGAGALSTEHTETLRTWVGLAALADLGDALSTLVAFPHLPRRGRWLVLASALGAAVLGGLSAAGLAEHESGDP